MFHWLLLGPLLVGGGKFSVRAVSAAVDKTLGVPPELLSRYVPPNSGNWKCLDDSKEIPWDFVNDDSCDCPDGSDEPGTSACPNTTFYCRNEGHIGASIFSSRVNDGLCEPECCDGSDEQPGVCPNRCKEIGEEYRARVTAENKLRKTGSKIRSTYIAFAAKEQKRLQALVANLETEIQTQEKEVDRVQAIVDRQDSLSAASLEHKKESPLYQSLLSHKAALKSLNREYQKRIETERELSDILDSLRSNYNPNYQDMAVLEAVRSWEAVAGLPHIGVEADAAAAAAQEEEASDEEDDWTEENVPEGQWTLHEIESNLTKLIDTNPVDLLLEHEEHMREAGDDSILFDLASYLPDSIISSFEDFKDTFISWLETLHIISRTSHSADLGISKTSKFKSQLTSAQTKLRNLRNDKTSAERDLNLLFDVTGFGAQGEWKKLEGQCLEKDTGDYIYELCFFKEAKQKPKNGGQNFSLGKFDSWDTSSPSGSQEYYQKQNYKRGTRCWNGPERSVVFLLSCGTENTLQTVAELEKCEYQFTGTTPALCLPLDDDKSEGKDEL